ncbi:phenylalanine--tRNA ligase subunit alpha [Candidatus Omnitrophota bacterium]
MSNFNLENLNQKIDQDFAGVADLDALENLRIKYLGRKGIIAELTAGIAELPAKEKPGFGRGINQLKQRVSGLLESKKQALEGLSAGAAGPKKRIDVTLPPLPGEEPKLGHRHLVTQVIEEICDIFIRMGFVVTEGPEIESEFNNFTALNIPLEHPSRDMFDTFYLHTAKGKERLLLRSHTSPVQIRTMQSRKPPLAVVVPGRVYRPDAVDASHSFVFHQIEGFMVDRNISFADLKGTLEFIVQSIFGKETRMRFRPHFFPFTEPSAEVDIACIICKGKGCSVCGRKGWLEILGSGMIHPTVFKQVGYPTGKYTGFAFGMGVERIAMLKYRINDIRLFFENDLWFLRQF